MDDLSKFLQEAGFKPYPRGGEFVIVPPAPEAKPVDEFMASLIREIQRVEACGRDPTKLIRTPTTPFTGDIDPNNPFHASLRR